MIGDVHLGLALEERLESRMVVASGAEEGEDIVGGGDVQIISAEKDADIFEIGAGVGFEKIRSEMRGLIELGAAETERLRVSRRPLGALGVQTSKRPCGLRARRMASRVAMWSGEYQRAWIE